jgi:Uncharacterized protein conserved in cyanobacteria
MATVLEPAQERVVLHNVSWRTYESLLDDYAESGARLTYDHGILEIMSPLPLHEEKKQDLNLIVEQIAIEWRLRYRNFGSATLRRADMERGSEPDVCYYFRNFDRLPRRRQLDLSTDPSPDLAIEIDLTNPSLDRLPLYAQFGIPEVWRCVPPAAVTLLVLDNDGRYQESEESTALAPLSREVIEAFLNDEAAIEDRPTWAERIRQWAREHGPED